MDKELENYLSDNNIQYIEHLHKAVFTVEESENLPEIKKIPGVRAKSLFLKDKNKNYYLVCMPGKKRLNMKNLKILLNLKDLSFASPEELKSELNLTPGSVSLFGMIHAKKTTVVIDEEIWKADISSFHPNINTSTLEIKHEDLAKFMNSLKSNKLILKLD